MTSNDTKKEIIIFFVWLALSFIIVVSISAIILKLGGSTTLTTRITTIIQDVFLFIIPPLATTFILQRNNTCLRHRISFKTIIIIILIMIVQVPMMNRIIMYNELIPLPYWLTTHSEVAENSINLIFGNYTKSDLFVSITIVGCLAAFAEELFFRGFLLGISRKKINLHYAIWTVAFIFSLVHFQFEGFIPRMMLGGLFGYLVVWTKSLWASALAHFINNTMAIIALFFEKHYGIRTLNTLGTTDDWWNLTIFIVSVFFSVWAIYVCRQVTRKSNQDVLISSKTS